ncbi:hypothetical protein PROSTU_01377 [Providencia stuartii ATCC 25827]|uniref:Uncharacterized protein n=1 Tax=Providencia stuartii ATCC 25827 TaxID=471874 RepID=A0AA87CUE9_PROST|nr:hypothetical protein PROSTU_01377 [Providencia stuartii ATCC 25827]
MDHAIHGFCQPAFASFFAATWGADNACRVSTVSLVIIFSLIDLLISNLLQLIDIQSVEVISALIFYHFYQIIYLVVFKYIYI